MAPKKNAGAGSKKEQGQARKADAAAGKKAAKDQEVAQAEDQEWQKGAKDSGKKQAAADKAAEAARKKAEKAALVAEEEQALAKTAAKTGNKRTAEKKPSSRGLDLSQLDDGPSVPKGGGGGPAINATGIDNALDALDITSNPTEAIDRHPERRFKAAYAAYEERRLDEMKDEKGLRKNQKIMAIRKEFEKHPDNPFNQVAGKFDSTKEELKALREEERKKIEGRLVQ
ncbi:DUF1014-domain-containing protein [Tothia fuscella]|uniref:DUF1014-domain-containing protein n=1 Tax=Tothia fuscella TaxID=1048955 RepID=A0A9P4P1L1_9PEZI|nr:DUF1014-domain-containing protein [Tothia fuscella]